LQKLCNKGVTPVWPGGLHYSHEEWGPSAQDRRDSYDPDGGDLVHEDTNYKV
jgi:hypothetical protein